jgi:hypothetical protein
VKPINRNRRAIRRVRKRMQAVFTDFLEAQAPAIAAQLADAIAAETIDVEASTKGAIARLRKDDGAEEIDPVVIGRILRAVQFDDWATIIPDLEAIYVDALGAGHTAGFKQIDHLPLPGITDQVHEEAVRYAHARAAELVGMKWEGQILMPNPDARWQITESTRERLRGDVERALLEGWSNDRLAEELEGAYAFSSERALTIARTETARADVEGNMEAYRASGEVSGKRWLLGSEHGVEDECDTAAALGEVPLDDDFGGIGDPPAHPGCVCDVIPVLADD